MTKARNKFKKVMHEFGKGGLRSGGTGKKVTDPKQAQAIAFAEQKRVNKHKKK